MQEISCYKTLVNNYLPTWHHTPQDLNLLLSLYLVSDKSTRTEMLQLSLISRNIHITVSYNLTYFRTSVFYGNLILSKYFLSETLYTVPQLTVNFKRHLLKRILTIFVLWLSLMAEIFIQVISQNVASNHKYVWNEWFYSPSIWRCKRYSKW